jgi:hypothetical protein
MLHVIKRTAVTAIAAAAIVTPSAADASIGYIPHTPTASRPASTTMGQSTGGGRSSGGFDWADAGIGAAVTVVVSIGAGAAMRSGRRRVVSARGRHARHAATS